MQVKRHQGGSPTTRLTLRQAGNLSRGQQNVLETLKTNFIVRTKEQETRLTLLVHDDDDDDDDDYDVAVNSTNDGRVSFVLRPRAQLWTGTA